ARLSRSRCLGRRVLQPAIRRDSRQSDWPQLLRFECSVSPKPASGPSPTAVHCRILSLLTCRPRPGQGARAGQKGLPPSGMPHVAAGPGPVALAVLEAGLVPLLLQHQRQPRACDGRGGQVAPQLHRLQIRGREVRDRVHLLGQSPQAERLQRGSRQRHLEYQWALALWGQDQGQRVGSQPMPCQLRDQI
ncbi:hypothetical protein B0T19DRAFT_462183, partial [Cercophora scortea]